jgi:hypothetical protein
VGRQSSRHYRLRRRPDGDRHLKCGFAAAWGGALCASSRLSGRLRNAHLGREFPAANGLERATAAVGSYQTSLTALRRVTGLCWFASIAVFGPDMLIWRRADQAKVVLKCIGERPVTRLNALLKALSEV